MQAALQKATLGGGCFWCLEAVFRKVKGVAKTECGYSGGSKENANYYQVCQGDTNHIEVCQIDFDPNTITYKDVLRIFFNIHDPTTKDQQGNDIGYQYKSIVFYHNEDQKKEFEEIIAEIKKEKLYKDQIVTEIRQFNQFYKAEDKHQNFFEQNQQYGYCKSIISPKLEKFQKKFKDKCN